MQDAGDVGKQIFQHCLTPHCRMLQQQCYVTVIFLWVPVAAQATFQDLACSSCYGLHCVSRLLYRGQANLTEALAKTNYKLHIEVVVSLGPMRPLKWPGNAFLCVECLSVNVIITDLRCFPTSLTAV